MIRNTKSIHTLSLFLDTTRLVAMRVHAVGGRVEVTSWGSVPMPPGAVEGAVVQDPIRVAEVLRPLLKQIGARERRAVVALPSEAYLMRPLRLPEVPALERRTVARGELEEMGALRYGSGAFDFLWVPRPPHEGRRQADAYTYYTGDPEVDTLRETLRLAGLQIERLEPGSLGMIRAFLANQAAPAPVAVLCPTRSYSDLCIHDGQTVRYLRRIPGGWDELEKGRSLPPGEGDAPPDVNKTLEVPQRLSWENPQEAAADQTVWNALDEARGETPEPFGEGVQAETAPGFLESEMARSLAFFAREYPGAPRPEYLVVLGQRGPSEAFRSMMGGRLPLLVVQDDPLQGFQLPPPVAALPGGDDQDALLAAIGAALGETDAGLPPLDVSQQEAQARTRRRSPMVLLAGMAGSTVWMIVAALAAVTLAVLENRAQNENSNLTAQIAALQAERAPLLRYHAVEDAALAAQQKAQLPARSALGRLAASATPGVALTNVHVAADGTVSIEGTGTSPAAIQSFARSVGEGRTIKAPAFQKMNQDAKGGVTFHLVGRFRAPAVVAAAPASGQ